MAEEKPTTSPILPEADPDSASAAVETTTEAKSADSKPEAPQAATEKSSEQEKAESANQEPAADGEGAKETDAPADKPAKDKITSGGEEPDAEKVEGSIESAAPAAEANGTPASNKKQAKRRSSVGVPEHKTKRLNKKKSQVLTNPDAKAGDYYFARMKGYAPWPSIICDEEMLPSSLLNSRPVTARRVDGSWREDLEDGGKRVMDRTFPVMFLHTNEFAWMSNTDLTPLDPETILESGEKGKGKQLWAAYGVAAQKNDLDHFKELLADHQRALQEDEDAKASRKGKSKRKSQIVEPEEAPEDVEMDDAGEAEVEEDADSSSKKNKSKKRKKDADSDVESAKPTKTPKTSQKLKLSTPKTPNGTATPSKAKASTKKEKASTTKKTPAKSKDADEEMTDAPKTVEKALSPAEAKKKKEKEVLYLRYKLQKGFVTRDVPPKEEEMTTMADYFGKLEKFADLEVSIIRQTKIHRVLKAIIKLGTIPRDNEFHFKQRAQDLLGIWNKVLAAEPETPSAAAADKEASATNGLDKKDEKDVREQVEKEEKEEKEEEKEAEKKEAEKEPAETETETAKEPEKPAAATEEQTENKEEAKPEEPKPADEPKGEEPKPAEEAKSEEPKPEDAKPEESKPAEGENETA